MINPQESEEKIIRLLLSRLERISVDSYWAHRASGVRGALLKLMENDEINPETDKSESSHTLIRIAFEILNNAARQQTRKR
jgi:hypothetical protein